MNTFLLSILVANLVLEVACAYLLYKKRHLVAAAIRQFLGISDIRARIESLEHETSLISRRTRFIRRQQKAEAAAVNAQYGRKVI
jgi:hypothetical protein